MNTPLEFNLNEANHITATLIEIMQQEKESLIKKQIADMQRIMEKKLTLLQKLEKNHCDREKLLQQYNLEHSQAGIYEFVERVAPRQKKQLTDSWKNLEESAKACKQLNQENGILINNSLNAIQRLKDALYECDEKIETYSHKGKKEIKRNQVNINKA